MSAKGVIESLIKKLSGQQYLLVINKEYVEMLGGDATAALLLGQLIYWSDGRAGDKDGWIVKSYKEWTDELGLSKYQVSRAAKKLAAYGLKVACKRSNFHGGGATNHYLLDFDVLAEKVTAHLQSKLDSKEASLSDSQHPELSDSKEASLSDSQHPLQSIHRLSETTTKTKNLAPVPDAIPAADMDNAIYGESHKVPELVEHESIEEKAVTRKNQTTDSVKEKEIIVFSDKQKEKEPSDKQKYAELVKTGLRFPDHEYAMPGKLAKWFRDEGNFKNPIDMPLSLEDMVKFIRWMKSELAGRDSKYLPRSHERLQEYVIRWREWLSANPPEDIPDISVEDLHPHHQEQYAKLAALPDLNIHTNPPAPEEKTGEMADPELVRQMLADLAQKFSGDFTKQKPESDDDAA